MKKKMGVGHLKGDKKEAGFVLITVLTLSFLLFGLAMSYADILLSERRLVQASFNSLGTQGLAEAGIEQAMWEYNYNSALFTGWSGTTTKTKTVTGFTDSSGTSLGNYSISVDTSANIITSSSTYTNAYGASLLSVLKAKASPEPMFSSGIFADGAIQLKKAATINSYNSTTGQYGGSNILTNGDVATNSGAIPAVTFTTGSVISGDVGTGSTGTVSGSSMVTGAISNNFSKTMPNNDTLYASPIALCLATPSLGSRGSGTINSAGYYRYTDITLGMSDTLTVAPGSGTVYLYLGGSATALNMAKTSNIRVSSGNLVVLIAGAIDIDKDCTISYTTNSITHTSNPQGLNTANLTLVGTSACTSVSVDKNFLLSGTLSIPNAPFSSEDKDLKIYGAIIADSFDVKKEAEIHYDENLGTNGPTSGYKINWYRRVS